MRLTVVAVLSCSASAWRTRNPRGAAWRCAGPFVLPEDLSANDGLTHARARADNGDYVEPVLGRVLRRAARARDLRVARRLRGFRGLHRRRAAARRGGARGRGAARAPARARDRLRQARGSPEEVLLDGEPRVGRVVSIDYSPAVIAQMRARTRTAQPQLIWETRTRRDERRRRRRRRRRGVRRRAACSEALRFGALGHPASRRGARACCGRAAGSSC